ncbi:MAG: hypothetical protein ACKOW3_01985 [Hyphomicrobium sp.]
MMKNVSYHSKLFFGSLGLMIAGGLFYPISVAFADQCAAQCYAQENACRKATNDDPKCGVELTKCLQTCRGK